MAPIMGLASSSALLVLEDAAQAHGALYRARAAGSIGDAGTFSFYPAKNLGAWGDAGAVITSRTEVADTVRLLRSHGESPRYCHRMVGTTARLDAIQAAILGVKLAYLDAATLARKRVAQQLRDALADIEAIVLPAPVPSGGDHVYHQFVIRTQQRDATREFLAERGIASGIHYPIPIHRSDAYRALAPAHDEAPRATRLAGEILSLPIFPSMTEGQIGRVADALREFSMHKRASAVGTS
jgi:dTDP-4-amino-4,6-dideoxygalactose transaminase